MNMPCDLKNASTFIYWSFDTHCMPGMLHNWSNHKEGDSSFGVRTGEGWNTDSPSLSHLLVAAIALHF